MVGEQQDVAVPSARARDRPPLPVAILQSGLGGHAEYHTHAGKGAVPWDLTRADQFTALDPPVLVLMMRPS